MATDVVAEPKLIEEETKEKEMKEDLPPPVETAKEETKKEEKKPEEPKVKVHKADYVKDVVYLYQFSRTPKVPSLSPFCLKVETWLRLNGINFENVDHKMKLRSAKGQLPFIELNGEEIADSVMIISKLSSHFGADPDNNLTKEQRNMAHALTSMIENHLNWVHAYWRTKHPDDMIKGYQMNLQHALGSRLPNGLLNFVFKFTHARKGTKKVKAHGLGVHSAEEVFEFGKKDLAVLEENIADKDFFFGEKPTNLDVVAFAHLSQILGVDKGTAYDLRDWMETSCPALMAFMERMKTRCFPDWDEILSTLALNTHIKKEEEPVEEKKEAGEEKKEEKAAEETKEEKKEPAAEEKKE